MSNVNVLLCAANPDEFRRIKNDLDISSEEKRGKDPVTTYWTGERKVEGTEYKLILRQTGRNQLQTTSAISDVHRHWELDVAIMIGVAGGIKEDEVSVGDVVVSDCLINYEPVKTENSSQGTQRLNRRRTTESRSIISEVIKSVVPDDTWSNNCRDSDCSYSHKALFEPVASGEKLQTTDEDKLYDYLKEQASDAVAVEMEGYAFMREMGKKAIPAVMINAISDVPPDSERKTEEKIESVMSHAIDFLTEFLNKYRKHMSKSSEGGAGSNRRIYHESINLETADTIQEPSGKQSTNRTRLEVSVRPEEDQIEFNWTRSDRHNDIYHSSVLIYHDITQFAQEMIYALENNTRVIIDNPDVTFAPQQSVSSNKKTYDSDDINELETYVDDMLVISAFSSEHLQKGAIRLANMNNYAYTGPMINLETESFGNKTNKEILLNFFQEISNSESDK